MDYPYYKNYITLSELKKDFKSFKNSTIKKLDSDKNQCLVQFIIDINKYSKITDYFSEECRVKCSFRNFLPPIIKFQKIKDQIPDTKNYWKIEEFLQMSSQFTEPVLSRGISFVDNKEYLERLIFK